MKRIAVGFITYPINWHRVDYLTRAVVAAKQCIEASQDELVWFCSREACPPYIRRSTYVVKFGWHNEGTPADSGAIEVATNQTLRHYAASICAYPSEYFQKHGPVSASR